MKGTRISWWIRLTVPLFTVAACSQPNAVSGTEARQLVEAGARLVDVRSPAEYQVRHLPGAVNVPVTELARRVKELEPKDRDIVVYCRTGNQSRHAMAKLRAAGFSKLHDLGPMSAW